MTGNLQVDFFADLAAMHEQRLAALGHTPPVGASAREIVTLYVNLERRRIATVARRVHIADDLVVPPGLQAGYDLVRKTAETGGNLNLHLSASVKDDPDYDDPLINDWDMHHLHLGTALATSGRSAGLIGRTKELLFAHVAADDIYFVGIGEHGDWARKRLLESMKRNWPELLAGRIIDGLKLVHEISEEDHLELRKAGIAVLTEVDGAHVFSPGGSYATSGRSLEVIYAVDRFEREARALEKRFHEQLPQILLHAAKAGVNATDLDFHLKGVRPDGMLLVKDDRTNINVLLYSNA